jgi:hypothetical protein
MKTLGCNWAATNPVIEIDFTIELGSSYRAAITEQTFDLSSVSPNEIGVIVALENSSNTENTSYSSWTNNAGAYVTVPGTSGTVIVHTYDPTSQHMDIALTNVVLPISNLGNTYPGAPPTSLTISSAEIVR